MSKQENLIFAGKVVELMPGGKFRVKLENNHTVIGTLAGKLRQHRIHIILGDSVDVEITPYDVDRGRIIYRHR